MSPFLRKLLFRLVKSAILAGWLTAPVARLKIKAVSTYLKAVDGVRRGVLGVVALLLVLMLLVTGFVAIHAGLFILFDWSLTTIGIVTLCLGTVYFTLPVILILYLTSERTWMKISGGNELVRKVTQQRDRRQTQESGG
jgi:hypothetical protein